MPHPIRRARKILANRLPQAKWVRQSSPQDGIVICFEPGLTPKEKGFIKAAFRQTKASTDGTKVQLDAPDFRRASTQITLAEVVEKVQPIYAIGKLHFTPHAQGEDSTTKVTITILIGAPGHLRANVANIESFTKTIADLGPFTTVSQVAPETMEIILPRRFKRPAEDWWLDQFTQKLSEAAAVMFDVILHD